MNFLETVRRAKAYLEEQGRVSLHALRLEFGGTAVGVVWHSLDDGARVETRLDGTDVAAMQGSRACGATEVLAYGMQKGEHTLELTVKSDGEGKAARIGYLAVATGQEEQAQ